MNATHEEWRPAVGFEGYYEVSSLGRARSVSRLVAGPRKRVVGRVLSPKRHRRGHHRYQFHVEGRARYVQAHRLVLEAFVGPCPPGMEACHNNGDPSDNRVTNLRWDTRSNNTLDAVRHGTQRQARKTHCPQGHLYDQVDLNGDKPCRRCRTCRNERRRKRRRDCT
jgi:hypothetical protein